MGKGFSTLLTCLGFSSFTFHQPLETAFTASGYPFYRLENQLTGCALVVIPRTLLGFF